MVLKLIRLGNLRTVLPNRPVTVEVADKEQKGKEES